MRRHDMNVPAWTESNNANDYSRAVSHTRNFTIAAIVLGVVGMAVGIGLTVYYSMMTVVAFSLQSVVADAIENNSG